MIEFKPDIENHLLRLHFYQRLQARAKSELRENVTRDDALDVIEIVKRSLSQVLEHKLIKPTIPNSFGEDLDSRSMPRQRSAAKSSLQTEVFAADEHKAG